MDFMRTITASFIAACLSALWLSAAAAADFSLTKVADKNTAIPNGTGNFTGFFNDPWISGKNVFFGGFGSNFRQVGLYLFDGHALRRVVDKSTPIPDGTGNFTEFQSLGLSGTNVLFEGSGSSGQRGLYLFDGSGQVTGADFLQFRLRFLQSV